MATSQENKLEEKKPADHLSWVQIWEHDKNKPRRWKALIKEGSKYKLEDKYTYRHVATPWINTAGVVTTVPEHFQALQRYLSNISSRDFNHQLFVDYF